MKDRLPIDYTDYPKPYLGQLRRFPSEQYGDFPDRANPDAPAGQSGENPPGEQAAFGPLDTEGATGGKHAVEDAPSTVVVTPPIAWSGVAVNPDQVFKKKKSIEWRQGPIR